MQANKNTAADDATRHRRPARSKKVFGEECLANEFVFARQGTDTHSHADASCGHLIQPLVGQTGTTEIVVGAENEVGGAQVDVADIRRDDFLGIAGHPGKTETDGQFGQHPLSLDSIGRNHYENFTFFFEHILAYFIENVYLYSIINWDILSLIGIPNRRRRSGWPQTNTSLDCSHIIRQFQQSSILLPRLLHDVDRHDVAKEGDAFRRTTVGYAELLSVRQLITHLPDGIIEAHEAFRGFITQGQ